MVFQVCVRLGSRQGQLCSVSSSPPGNAAHLWWAMYQLVHLTLLQSIAFILWLIYLPKIVRQCGQLSSSLPGSAAHLWWAMYQFDHPIIYKDNFYSIQARDKPRRILFILFFTSWQCSSFVMGNVPIGLTQNDREWPIWSDSQLFKLFPTEAAQNDSEWPILPNLQLFKYFPSEATQNDWEWPISSDS